ncbi:hypothetical protein HL658_34890 [Azospirillum sp. RWY-5-1]|uniref:histidine kinase n=1 Tax=Azospirillum oleiclasticum TaxID=2735135 RepID=A0ABX2TIM2_9PROT|nr:ATP-binding protein [Azospirillum oleiclasticum]NYZ17760.1 hypothetical protein [Azospirillum oleiclasticum]NYZ24194.1 hypothetical protein [Azospirillum oleiclasticum]
MTVLDDPIEEFWSLFGAELDEYLTAIESILAASPVDSARVDELFRAFHSVKGGSAALALRCIETVAHAAEDVLHLVRAGKRPLSTELVSALLAAVDEMRRLQGTAMATRQDQPVNAALVAALKAHLADAPAASAPPPLPPPAAAPAEPPAQTPQVADAPALTIAAVALEGLQDAVLGLIGAIDAEDPADAALMLAEAAEAASLAGIAVAAQRLTPGDRWGWADLVLRLRGAETASGRTLGAVALSAALEAPFADLLLEHAGTLKSAADDPAVWLHAARLLAALEIGTAVELAETMASRLLTGEGAESRDDADELADLLALIGISVSAGMELPAEELAALRARWLGATPAVNPTEAVPPAGRAHPWPAELLERMALERQSGRALALVLLDLESEPATADTVLDRLRDAHPLFNRSRLDLGDGLFEYAVAVDGGLDAFATGLADADPAGACLRRVGACDEAAAPLAELHPAVAPPALPAAPPAVASPPPPPPADVAAPALPAASPAPTAAPRPADAMVRVPSASIDAFMDVIGDIRLGLTSLAMALEGDRGGRAVRDEMRRMERAVRQLYDGAVALRVVPIGTLFTRLMRPIRDTAVLVGKEVGLVTAGEDVQVDKAMIEMLVDPLTHIVRNCVDHGIEAPGRRLAAGKPAAGTIRIRARQTASLAIVEVADDGAGIDTARVREKAVAKGLIGAREAAALDDAGALELILLPGFSTRDEVTATSGRGVGMDIVQTAIRKLGGRLSIDSRPGAGTRMVIEFPVSAAMQRLLAVEVAGQTLAIHERTVGEVVDAPPGSLLTIGRRLSLPLRGRFLPVVDLGPLLGLRPAGDAAPEGRCTIVVADDGQSRIGLRVDRIEARREVFFRRLHPLIERNPLIAGAAVIGAGQVMFALDTAALFDLAAGWLEPETPRAEHRPAPKEDPCSAA